MNKQRILWSIVLVAVLALSTGAFVTLRVGQATIGPNEPQSLSDLVNFPKVTNANLKEKELMPMSPEWENALVQIQSYEGTMQIYREACTKYSCPGGLTTPRDSCMAGSMTRPVMDCMVTSTMGSFQAGVQAVPIEIVSLSLHSVNPTAIGTQMVIKADCDNMTPDPNLRCSALYVDGNVFGPSREPLTEDPFIIVNAEPYFFLRWHWWDPFAFRIIFWDYWWHDSHNHPNWFWGVYWWWRVYVDYYVGIWVPWWWWQWHWIYWRCWYWWSTFFPF